MLKKDLECFFPTMYRNADSPSWTACRGWSRCRSQFWAPPPAPPPGSSPRACPRWRSWWTPPHSHFCPWLSGAPPEQLHVIKLVPVTTAVYCFCFCICKRVFCFFFQMYINKKPEDCQLIGCLIPNEILTEALRRIQDFRNIKAALNGRFCLQLVL